MADENPTPPPVPRSPLPDGCSKPAMKVETPSKVKPTTQIKMSQEPGIQVPSTYQSSQEEETSFSQHNSDSEHGTSNKINVALDSTDARDNVDMNAELPNLDWDEFETRYKKAIHDATAVEDKLFKDFDKLVVVRLPLL
jgi:hypothetical protein